MKKVYLLLFTCLYLPAISQNDSAERAGYITEIELAVAAIDDTVSLAKFSIHKDTMNGHESTFCVWMGPEGINKIRQVTPLKEKFKIEEYYYSWNKLLLKKSGALAYKKNREDQYKDVQLNAPLENVTFSNELCPAEESIWDNPDMEPEE